jgi:predicted metal-binding protein
MALSINGKRIGRAAQTERQDLADEIETGRSAPPRDEEPVLLAKIDGEEKFIEKYQQGYPTICDEARRRLKFYRDALEIVRNEKALAHVDLLVGDERLTTTQMIDAAELFTPQSYKDKHVPDKTCPKCGGLLIVNERKRHLTNGGDDVTPFVACSMWERTGCRYKEGFTAEVKAAIDNAVTNVEVEF